MLFLITREDAAQVLQDYLESLGVFGKVNLLQANLVPTDPQFGLWLVEWTSAFELRKLTVEYARVATTGVGQDPAMTTHHFLNLTAGVPDATWDSTDYGNVETAFDAYWTALKPFYASTTKLSKYVWRADGPAFRPFGTALSPTLRSTTRSVVGTATGQGMPPQVAMTVTERTGAHFTATDVEGVGTQVRNRWGRYYLPAPSVQFVGDGRIVQSNLATMQAAAHTFYNACTTAGLIPVVYSPTVGHAWSVLELSMDDIFDVIRSRRYVTPLNRVTTAPTQP